MKEGPTTREVDSSKRPTKATKGPVLRIVHKERLAGMLMVIAECFKNALLKANKLIETCATTALRKLGGDRDVTEVRKIGLKVRAGCASFKGVRCLVTGQGLSRLRPICASGIRVAIFIPVSRVNDLQTRLVRKAGKRIILSRRAAY